MTILFFARRFYPHIGGVEKHVYEISKRLKAKGHHIIIISEQEKPNKHTNLPSAKVMASLKAFETYQIPVSGEEKRKKFEVWQWLWRNRSLLMRADVIHCHDVFFWYLPFRFLYLQKKVFTTFHGYESYPITRKAILIRKISEVLSWGNICIGDFIKKWYGTKPDYVSYGAVEQLTIDHRQLTNKESAVFMGRLDEQTGIKTYIDAYKIIKKKHWKFDLLVVGEGKDKKYIPSHVKQKGFEVNPEKYFAHYRFAFVSRYLSILEAMAAKRLVFAVFDNPVKQDYLKLSPMAKNMVITDSPEELAQSVEFYLQHPQNEADHISQAYEFAKKQTWEKMVEMYIQLWQKR